MRSHGKQAEDVARLTAENAELRRELEDQWEENHAEHCSWPIDHSNGQPCQWPRPEALDRVVPEQCCFPFRDREDAARFAD